MVITTPIKILKILIEGNAFYKLGKEGFIKILTLQIHVYTEMEKKGPRGVEVLNLQLRWKLLPLLLFRRN